MIFNIKEPILESNCTFYVGEPFSKVKSVLENQSHPDWLKDRDLNAHLVDNGTCFNGKTKEGYPAFLVWVKEWKSDIDSIGVLAHEILHFSLYLAESEGIPVRVENDEIICRIQSFYLKSCLIKLTYGKNTFTKPRKVHHP